MNLEKRIEMGEVKQIPHERARAGAFQICVLGARPRMQQHQLSDTGAIHGMDAAKIQNYPSLILQKIADQAGKCNSLIAIYDATLAVNNHHVAAMSGFQTELQLRLLGKKFQAHRWAFDQFAEINR
jgi:hypothetical protein